MRLNIFDRTPRTVLEITLGICLLTPSLVSRIFGQAQVYPEPRQMEILENGFTLNDQALIVLPRQASKNDSFLANLLEAELVDRYGLALRTEHLSALPASRHAILMGSMNNPLVKEYCSRHRLQVTDSQPGPEGYVLQVSENLVLIAGSDEAGAFYGLQSLRQLIEKGESGMKIRGIRIRDWPYKPFRGIKLYLPGHQNIPFFRRFVRNLMALY
jgi:Glycosyl hydrolase family 20, domain 2